MIRFGGEKKPILAFKKIMLLLLFLGVFLKFFSISYQNILEIFGISEMDLQMWTAVI